MARKSPADKLERMNTVTAAWEHLSPEAVFFGQTLAQFKKVIQPSLDARVEIANLQKRLRAAIAHRDVADARSMRILRGVAYGVVGDPNHTADGALYAAMGYVRKSARRKGRVRKK